MDFLIDSGADISLISLGRCIEMDKAGNSVQGIGGQQPIGPKTWYDIRFSCDRARVYKISLRETYLAKDKVMIILGRDFLSQFSNTEFDWKNSRVRLGDHWIFLADSRIPSIKVNDSLPSVYLQQLEDLLTKFPGLFATNPKAPRCTSGVTHSINSTSDQPVKSKVRRIPKKWEAEVNQQVIEMTQHGIIEPSRSPFNSNPLLVSKSDQTKRFVIDFRLLNKNTMQDTYPLPAVDELIEHTLGCTFFTQLDLASGYWTVPISKEHCHKTAFSVPRGKFQFKRMPFGLKNAQATFQRHMDALVQEMSQKGAVGVDAYVDNIMVCSQSFEEHMKSLHVVLSVLDSYNMSLRKDKCEFAFDSMEFLGFLVNGKTVQPGSKNIDKIKDFPAPKSRKELQRFLGIANYNRRFIDNYSELTAPLNRLTSPKVPFVWTECEQDAFTKVKLAFHEGLLLYIPDWSKPFLIRTDASKVAVGSVLGQTDSNGSFRPVGYHSETLNKNTKNWTATERELYAIISASRKWKPYCYEKVTFYSDHEPLRHIHKQKDPRGKIGRWILELENLDYSIKYLKGPDNQEADYMSRIMGSDPPSPNPLVFACELESLIKKSQTEDLDITNALSQLKQGKDVSAGPYKNFTSLSVRDDLLCKGNRIVIPKGLTNQIIQEYHGQSHPGVENSILLLSSRFYWKGMRKQIESFVLQCRTCVQCKHGPKPKAPVQDHREVEELFEMIAIDIASMPTSRRGNCCFLLVIDMFSKLMTAVALPNAHADTIVDALWYRWFGYFGMPRFLQSDQGSNVDGKTVRELCKELAIKKLRSSSYHPAGNGSAERAIGYLKTILRSMCLSRNFTVFEWDELLPEAILMFNSTQNKSSKFSPFETAYGMTPHLPLDNKLGVENSTNRLDPSMVRENVLENRAEARSRYQQQANKSLLENDYKVGDLVLLKRNHGDFPKINPKWEQLFEVVKRIGPVCWGIVNFADGKSKIVHHDQLMPAKVKQDATWTVGDDTSGNRYRIDSPATTPVFVPNVPLTTPSRQIDKPAFSRNVFNTPPSTLHSVPSVPTQPVVVTPANRPTRAVRPVIGNRLIDLVGHHV